MVKWLSKELIAETKPRAGFVPGTDLNKYFAQRGEVMEFIGTSDAAKEWFERRQYEVEAARTEEPILYTPIYDIVQDANLPKFIEIFEQNRAGVVFEEVFEGGEVKFATVGTSEKSVAMRHFGAGIEYSKDFVVYNQFWRFAEVERDFGRAFNALLNHIHLNPILTVTYPAGNKTAASAQGSTLIEKIAHTLDNAVEHSKEDVTNGRRGPYVLLIAGGDSIKIANALNVAIQSGREQKFVGAGRIQTVIEYDGWTGQRGNQAPVTYSGVTKGKCYLISLAFKMKDFRSWVKQPLQATQGNPDVSRFILEQTIYDSYFTALAYPLVAVEEVTLPTS